jgi:hypothetical protein
VRLRSPILAMSALRGRRAEELRSRSNCPPRRPSEFHEGFLLPRAFHAAFAWFFVICMVIAGWSVGRTLGLFAAMSLAEGVMEMACVRFGAACSRSLVDRERRDRCRCPLHVRSESVSRGCAPACRNR